MNSVIVFLHLPFQTVYYLRLWSFFTFTYERPSHGKTDGDDLKGIYFVSERNYFPILSSLERKYSLQIETSYAVPNVIV